MFKLNFVSVHKDNRSQLLKRTTRSLLYELSSNIEIAPCLEEKTVNGVFSSWNNWRSHRFIFDMLIPAQIHTRQITCCMIHVRWWRRDTIDVVRLDDQTKHK